MCRCWLLLLQFLTSIEDGTRTIRMVRACRSRSNQKMNEYLKEIATLCRINKRLTVHVARHTFGTTVTLANNVSLQNVSKMLGHSSTRMTQHYARVLDKNIMEDMQGVAKLIFK